jgi:uncharacterized protein YndB with AHSA1/START domain
MGNVENIKPYLEPLKKSIVVRRAPSEAFEIFTARLSDWWPLAMFSIHQAEAATCGFEPRVGGAVYEMSKSGVRGIWGTVLVWEPPGRFAMTWHPGRPADNTQEVEVRFVAVPEGTRVELEHRGWATLGAAAEESRTGYDEGWGIVLGKHYAEACA